jgi:3-oxoacyl-[acyl-carrier protein] reductase
MSNVSLVIAFLLRWLRAEPRHARGEPTFHGRDCTIRSPDAKEKLRMDLALNDRTALVTAGSKGLGYGIADALAAENANVILSARTESTLVEAAARLRTEHGANVAVIPADVSSAADCERLAAESVSASPTGRIDILVTNTGGPAPGTFEQCDDEQWTAAFHSTLMNIVRLVRQLAPAMCEHGWGRIVNVASVSARQPITGLTMSNTFRPGIVGLAKDLSDAYAPRGVTVNTLCPGMHRTDRLAHLAEARGASDVEAFFDELGASIPVGRIGDPLEFGRVAAFLCSKWAGFITGQAIAVDGGAERGY